MKHEVFFFLIAAALFVLAINLNAEETKMIAPIVEGGVQKIDILAGSYFFKPNHIVVKVGVPVEMTIRKEQGGTPHDFVLRASEAGMDIKVELEKESKTVRFTPTKPGTYPFFCDHRLLFLKSHRERGMEGVLEVQE